MRRRALPASGVAGRIHHVVARLVLAGLREAAPAALGDADAVAAIEAAGDEGVPLEPYRRLLADALAYDGGEALLRAGQALRGLSDPILFVLLNADSPRLLLEKEARLAAFIHSRHRLVIEAEDTHSITIRHVSSVDEPPQRGEDLAACGQHIVLLEEIGCVGLRCIFPDTEAPERAVYDGGAFAAPAPGSAARWRYEWRDFAPARTPMVGLDELLLATARRAPLVEEQTLAESVEAVLRRDLGRTWKIAEVAEALDTSARSLQRALSGEGLRYGELVDRVRNDEAARLIEGTSLTLTEIGYACGFADGAHFSRSFKRRFGMPPSAYRAQKRKG